MDILTRPYCTDSDIGSFLFLLTNVLIVKSLWIKASDKCPKCKCQLNVNVVPEGVEEGHVDR